ncbi:AAA family ATPase [Bacteriovorax stolpii]|uniref:ATP-dependent chaperone ClpB n=1 Tax=Bacteriovorax stolpii TaxID=960 RepID=A0A2K9NPP1_BACTC|nr:AAA family ATPase [Bacteriovorax stolpii]AUN97496.1 ATP-dependent chaperone ClpB [Bacteriovorax stolpii]QDK42532.1 AAA family ATPase [Bacteriovorax stolpii]TDP52674.1 ATP-dependent Clp protease ATP-binding subunit ClpB [Bacteriovorax stolpii]
MNKFDSIVEGSLAIAQSEALKRKHIELTPYHLILGLMNNPQSFSNRALKKYSKDLEKLLDTVPTTKNKIEMENLRASSKLSEWLTYASSNAIQNGRGEIAETDLLKYLQQIVPEFKIDYNALKTENAEGVSEKPTFLTNLNELAESGKLDPVIGRSKEIRAVMEILGRRGKNNPVLVGPAGVGKTAIVEGLADAIVKGKVPDVLEGKTVYSLDLGALMAGTKYRGEFEERLQALLKFIKDQNGQAILFIDELHQLVGAGRTDGAMDAANLLKPALARGELHCIGATTPEEYQKYILNDSALDRRFRSVPVDEPTKEDAIEILMGIREKMEIHHGIKISDRAIYDAVFLSSQYITDKNLPDKAIDLIDEASSALKLSAEAMPADLVELEAEIRTKKIYAKSQAKPGETEKEIAVLEARFKEEKEKWEKEVLALKQVSELKHQLDRSKFELEQAQRNQDYEAASKLKYSVIPEIETKLSQSNNNWVLSTQHIANVISRQKGIPVEKILKSKQEQILELESYLKNKVFGQDKALNEIAEVLITAHAGLSDPTRPLGSFLLRGPSGVGKTETAKALAEFLFGSQDNLVRFDLSEFSEKHSVSKLIGAPAGYVGYEEGGILTEAIRKKPYSVILFDEVEKAHHDFSDILLQILDDGRLTDNKGRTIDFKNTIILITTNSKDLEHDFKPEVLGRLDAMLTYNALDNSIMANLIDKQVKLLNERLEGKDLHIELDKKVYEELAKRGYDPRFGARPLQSVFSQIVTRPLSKRVLEGHLEKGNMKGVWKDDNAEHVTFEMVQ